MKMHLVMAALAVSLLGGSSASAQVGGVGTSPLGAASPLTVGSGVPVAPTGIPFGATEMTTPGTSPAPSSTMGAIGCSSPGGPTSQAAAPLFDGGGMAGAASSGCAGTGAGGSSMPALPTLRAGRAGIPLGSTELGDAGLSPAPPVSTMFVSPVVPSVTAPLATMDAAPGTAAASPCPITGTFPDGSTTRQTRSSAGTMGAPGC
jgi:hypothetical protein